MSMTIDDADLIRSFKSGHHEVFEAIVAEHQAELIRHARRRTNDAGTAEDLVQEAFIRAYRAFDRINDDSRVRPWLHQILANVCVDDAYRRRRDDDKTERFSCDTTTSLVEPSIEQQLGLHIDDTGLEQALADLPDTHRQALIMRFVDQLDYDEIALTTGVSEPNARARVSRARNAMRRAIQGAAAFPIACYVLFRRPGKGALAAGPPPDPLAAMKVSESVGAASRMAVTLQPAIDTANSVVIHAPTALPLLTKAAIGIGAVAVAVSAAPENPIERPVPIVVEVEAAQPTIDALAGPIQLEGAAPAAAAIVTVPVAAVPAAKAPVPVTTIVAVVAAVPVPVTTAVAKVATTVAPIATVPIVAPVATQAPATTVPVTIAPTTIAPTIIAATTIVPTTLPPPAGGSFASLVTVVRAGPRLDLSGSVILQVADTSLSGSMSGRIGVQAPDPSGSYRIDATLTVQLESGTIDIRIAGYATSPDAYIAGEAPTNLNMSGVFRASGATGQLAQSGNVNGSLSGGALTLTLSN
jgi:RNA polymerase sigma-70 factor (ECF subfamily)